MRHRLTDNEIRMRVAAQRARWLESNTNLAWRDMHEAVDVMHGLCRVLDDHCHQAESDQDLSPDGVKRKVSQLGRQAMQELADFKPLKKAEKSATDNLDLLDKKMTDIPRPPAAPADAVGWEIRDHIRRQKSPVDFVMQRLNSPRILAAVLSEEGFLSGLSEAELNLVRERARRTLHPEQAAMQDKLTQAIADLRAGLEAAKRVVVERCELGQDNDDGRTNLTVAAKVLKTA